uniref:Abnormal cell migration protein 18-like fibronectin type I domain-containing protein n=1 Tax=Acrobeloides nanus TaxID=290746 RepID=A0A914CCP1_9BILA
MQKYFFVVGFILPLLIDAAPKMISSNSTASTSRYAYLTEYLLNGQRNVRWETMPANYVDAQGKPVPFSGNKGGSVVVGCYDAQGHERKNGEEYQRPNKKFFYRCTNGIEDVVACVGSDRTNRARIKVGQTLDVDGFWHKCESYPNGSVIYTQEDACIQNGKNIHVGDEIRVGYLRVICQNSGYKAVGCYYTDENNHPVPLEKGTTKSAGKVVHHCEDQGGDIRYFSTATGCTKRGKDYNEGEEFKENHLHYKCENGVVEIKGCYIDDKRDLAVGQDVVDPNHMVYRCYRLGGAVTYDEYYCGGNGGRSCKPEPIKETPNEAPMLAPGLKAPGYSSFSIVQKMGNDMVQSPGTLKLDLDKIFMGHQA